MLDVVECWTETAKADSSAAGGTTRLADHGRGVVAVVLVKGLGEEKLRCGDGGDGITVVAQQKVGW